MSTSDQEQRYNSSDGDIGARALHQNLGAVYSPDGIFFRVWAPKAQRVDVVVESFHQTFPLQREPNSYFSALISDIHEGALYKYQLNRTDVYPDPCSRFQPQGPHGPSMVINPERFAWTDHAWQSKGTEIVGHVIYELHIGAYTTEGTYRALIDQLAELKAIGVTMLEIMPLAEFPGKFNWGYDGVSLFAPPHVYGTTDELKSLINRAHELDLAVILDVVYNHLGPDGNYLKCFSDDYFTDRYKNDWGEAINFDGTNSAPVREFFIANACYWIDEYHFDGLRLDATQNIYDAGKTHIMADILAKARATAAPKKLVMIGENEPQNVKLLHSRDEDGYGFDGLWNDDFHHTAKVALTGAREAYLSDYTGSPQEFIAAFKYGFLYQGQYYTWQQKNRGTPVSDGISAKSLIIYLQNHDQTANTLLGQRCNDGADTGLYRALTTLFLLAPQTPMLFMGQEFGASTPFLFFADHKDGLAAAVLKGRKAFLSQFASIKSGVDRIDNPKHELTFLKSKLNLSERETHGQIYRLYKDLLRLRREDDVFRRQDRLAIDGAVVAVKAFIIRYKGERTDRLLVVNLGPDVEFSPCPEPLLGPQAGQSWEFKWSSEDISYGGKGVVEAFQNNQWRFPARSVQIYHG